MKEYPNIINPDELPTEPTEPDDGGNGGGGTVTPSEPKTWWQKYGITVIGIGAIVLITVGVVVAALIWG